MLGVMRFMCRVVVVAVLGSLLTGCGGSGIIGKWNLELAKKDKVVVLEFKSDGNFVETTTSGDTVYAVNGPYNYAEDVLTMHPDLSKSFFVKNGPKDPNLALQMGQNYVEFADLRGEVKLAQGEGGEKFVFTTSEGELNFTRVK